MSEHDPHDEHSSFIKTPKQLLAVIVLSFVVPIFIISLLASIASRSACDDAIEELGRTGACDAVLVERGDIEQRRGAADRMVFAFVRELVRARDDVARPAPP